MLDSTGATSAQHYYADAVAGGIRFCALAAHYRHCRPLTNIQRTTKEL
jgi:hypothetical protein